MTKTIAIVGATGQQGGGVVNVLLETPGWKVRAITRNVDGDKAKALAARGAEVVAANVDDEASLVKAFEGVQAIFGVTNFWEHLFTGKSKHESGELEAAQAWKLARAAAATSSLEHYIWSTLPAASKLTNGKTPCAHCDFKAEVDDRIRAELPELHKKTTYLMFGYYPSNMAFFPMFKPLEIPGSYGKHVQMVPTPSTSLIPNAGDLTHSGGIWARQILANPSASLGKYALVATETISFGEMLAIWSEVRGKQSVYVPVSPAKYTELWGVAGEELADQLVFGETVEDWTAGIPFVTKEELGIKEGDVRGIKETLMALKEAL